MSEYASERVNKLLDERDALRTRVAELEAALAEARAAGERQYEYNVGQIVRIAKLEAALVLAQRHLPKRYPLVHAEIKAALTQESEK